MKFGNHLQGETEIEKSFGFTFRLVRTVRPTLGNSF